MAVLLLVHDTFWLSALNGFIVAISVSVPPASMSCRVVLSSSTATTGIGIFSLLQEMWPRASAKMAAARGKRVFFMAGIFDSDQWSVESRKWSVEGLAKEGGFILPLLARSARVRM